jgi:hypothetical protein
VVNKAKAVPLFLKGDEVLAPEGDKKKPTRATTLLLFLEKENLAELTSGRAVQVGLPVHDCEPHRNYPEGGRWLKTHDCEPHHNWHKVMKWLRKARKG